LRLAILSAMPPSSTVPAMAATPTSPTVSELVNGPKPWSISMGMPWVPSSCMLKPQQNRPNAILQNVPVRRASRGSSGWGRVAAWVRWACASSGSRSLLTGGTSRITNRAAGMVQAASSRAKPSREARQPKR
jgi:hypothetical protein